MNRYLAGATAAATVVLAALAGWALFGPPLGHDAPAPPAAPDVTTPPAAARIAAQATALARAAGDDAAGGMRYLGTEETLARPGQGYRVTFQSADPAPARGTDDAANAARQADWQRRFCTDGIKGEMAAQGVSVVTGRVVDAAGRTQYVADCVAGAVQQQQQVGPGGPML